MRQAAGRVTSMDGRNDEVTCAPSQLGKGSKALPDLLNHSGKGRAERGRVPTPHSVLTSRHGALQRGTAGALRPGRADLPPRASDGAGAGREQGSVNPLAGKGGGPVHGRPLCTVEMHFLQHFLQKWTLPLIPQAAQVGGCTAVAPKNPDLTGPSRMECCLEQREARHPPTCWTGRSHTSVYVTRRKASWPPCRGFLMCWSRILFVALPCAGRGTRPRVGLHPAHSFPPDRQGVREDTPRFVFGGDRVTLLSVSSLFRGQRKRGKAEGPCPPGRFQLRQERGTP